MHSKLLKGALLICAASSLLVSGCGLGQILAPTPTPTPAHLSDGEFGDAAREICQTLLEDYASAIETENLASRYTGLSAAYSQAASAMAELDITETSAPQGTQLRTSLASLAEALDIFWPALSAALGEALEAGESVNILVTEAGTVYLVNLTAGDMETADIDPPITLAVITAQEAATAAATALGLPDCAPWPEEDE
jgi:hypothetical protein